MESDRARAKAKPRQSQSQSQSQSQTKSNKGDITLSRALSKILRHDAVNLGLTISPDGYVAVDDLLRCQKYTRTFARCTETDIIRVVENNNKARYSLRRQGDDDDDEYNKVNPNGKGRGRGRLYIRAVQGHSIASVTSEALLEPVTADELRHHLPTIVHGTYRDVWYRFIRHDGLNRMRRNHIHFATGLRSGSDPESSSGRGDEGVVVSGMRRNCQILVYVDGAACANDGIPFYRSANGVLLTAGVGDSGTLPPKYFAKVVDTATQTDLLLSSSSSSSKTATITEK